MKLKRYFSFGPPDWRLLTVRVGAAVFSLMLVALGHWLVYDPIYYEGQDVPAVRARVVGIQEREINQYDLGDGNMVEETIIHFFARVLSGEHKDELVFASQSSDPFYPIPQKEIEIGDKILLHRVGTSPYDMSWQLGEYVRTDALLILCGVYALLFVILGGAKGVWALLGLAFTCGAVFLVFIPAVLAGRNIYFWSMLVCLYAIASTLLLVSGANKKSAAAGIGCAAGVLLSGLLTLVMSGVLMLTGFVNEDSVYLATMRPDGALDLKAVVFAGILIGALGAVMDVAMSIASALWELAEQTEEPHFGMLLRSGLAIGRDVMGTMANTLVLAYIGSSLSVVLLLIAYATSTLGLLNREMIVVEILQALVGSMGILCAIPLTSLISATLYPKRKKPAPPAGRPDEEGRSDDLGGDAPAARGGVS